MISVTKLNAAQAYNIIPDHVEISGTVRTLSSGLQCFAEREIFSAAQGIARGFGADVEFRYLRCLPGTFKHPEVIKLAVTTARNLVGPTSVNDAVGVSFGILSAWRSGSLVDRLLAAFLAFGYSVPVFVIGYFLIYFFAIRTHWLPVQEYVPIDGGPGPWFVHLILPTVALILATSHSSRGLCGRACLRSCRKTICEPPQPRAVLLLFHQILKNAGAWASEATLSGRPIARSLGSVLPAPRPTTSSMIRRSRTHVRVIARGLLWACTKVSFSICMQPPWVTSAPSSACNAPPSEI